MGGNIPRPIKVEVIRKWLQGKSRDEIAKELEIGAGTVSNIIDECRQNDSEFDLMREVAVKMKREGYTIESFAPLVRLRERLRRESVLGKTQTTTGTVDGEGQARGEEENDDVNIKTQQLKEELELEEKLQSLLIALQVFCFKQNLSIKEFVDVIYEFCRTANKLGIPLESLPGYVKGLENIVHRLEEEIQEKIIERIEAVKDYGLTLELLEDYDKNRPTYEENKKLREELDKVREERDKYEAEVMRDRVDKAFDDYNTCWVPEN